MCHENLYVEFYPKINFIVGNNGSGKSAVLTGIIVCLGAKASSTERAKSLRFLVKEGKSSATVTLELWNRGSDAFKPEVYGKFIRIQRKINGEGSGGGFKIISSEGKTISSRKDELVAICDHMKIQPDNPISILSQETAKKFIGSTNAHDKYQLFLKATHLSQLADDLSIIETTSNSAKDVVEQKKKVLPQLKEALLEAQKRYKRLQEAHDQHDKIQSLKNEMAWAHVVQVEKEEADVKLELDGAKSRIEQIESFIAKTNSDYEKAGKVVAELEHRRVAHTDKEAPLRAKLQKAKASRQAAQKEMEDSQRTLDRINKDNQRNRARLQELTDKIQQEMIKSQQSTSSKQDNANRRIESLEIEIKELEKSINEREHHLKQTDERASNVSSQIQEADSEKRQIEATANGLKNQLHDLERSKNDRLAAYGPNMGKVLSEIANETRWRDKPMGPLGKYIELSTPQWSNVIEQLLDNVLTAFTVTNYQDRHMLDRILKRNKCNSSIFVSNLDRFDYSSGEPDTKYLTILRCLSFKDEAIKRQLIVSSKIEKIILVEHRQEGDNIMNGAPQNIIGCYTKEGYQVGLRGGYGTFSLPTFSKTPKLSGFSADRVHNLRQQLQHFVSEVNAKSNQIATLQDEIRHMNSIKQTYLSEMSEARKSIRLKKIEINDIQQDMKDNEPANIGAMEDMKREQEEALALIKTQFEDETERFMAAREKIKEILAHIQEIDNQIKQVSESAISYQEDIDRARETQSKTEAAIDHYTTKLHSSQEKARAVEQKLAAISQRLRDVKEKAQAYCPERVTVTKAPTTLAREIQRAENLLAQAQECMGMSLEQCTLDLNTRMDAYQKARSEVKRTEVFLKDLTAAWEIRSRRWAQFRQYMAKRTRYSFMYNLSMRSFRGKLEFNHEDQTLTPIVNVNGQEQAPSKNKDPKSLSGGEKSFSTICLLLALWESMECPIRCLDEYDVFMDQANRKVSTSMIIDSARNSSRIQYILITPQGMDKDSVQPDVHVHRLGDPRPRSSS
ncbi:Structural maintenance of chromosomes protein 6, variant 2 [Entomophthora muscae]|nr:Structural maintenance of chromosomes protein 6, variant 2 [Entomophthora muscae]